MQVFMCLSCAAYVCVGVCLTLSYYVCACACACVCVCVSEGERQRMFLSTFAPFIHVFLLLTYRELLKSKYPLKRLFFSLSFSLYFCESSHCSPSASIPCTFAHRLPFSDLDQLITVYVAAHLRQLQINLINPFRCPTTGLMTYSVARLSAGSSSREQTVETFTYEATDGQMKLSASRSGICQHQCVQPNIQSAKQASTVSQPLPVPSPPQLQSYVDWKDRAAEPGLWEHNGEVIQGFSLSLEAFVLTVELSSRKTCCQTSRRPFALCDSDSDVYKAKQRPDVTCEGLLFWKGSIVYIVFLCSHFLCCQASGWWMSTTRTFAKNQKVFGCFLTNVLQI